MSGDDELGSVTRLSQALDEQLQGLWVQPVVYFLDAGERRRIWVIEERKQCEETNGAVRGVSELGRSTQAGLVKRDDYLASGARRILKVNFSQVR
jgi:hypothetical protein